MLRKRENLCREKRVAHRKQVSISRWDARVGIFGRACPKVPVPKSCAGYKNKIFVENVWAAVDKEMGFEEGKEFSYFLCSMKFKRGTCKIF